MILKRLKISTWIGDETNCYIVFDQESKETMVVDPAGDVDRIIEMINILQGNLKYIFLILKRNKMFFSNLLNT